MIKKLVKLVLAIIVIGIAVFIGRTIGRTEVNRGPEYWVPDGDGPVSFNSLDELDKTMLKTMAGIYDTCKKDSDMLWPEYSFQDVPLMMVRADKDLGTHVTGAFAFNIDKFDDDMGAVEVTDIPEEYELNHVMYLPYVGTNKAESGWTGMSNFGFAELQGVHVMHFKYYPEQDMHRKFVQFLTHEAFHEYVQVKLWKNVYNLTSTVDIEDDDYQEEAIQVELLRAVMAEDMMRTLNKDDLKEIVTDSMTLQQYIFDKYPDQKQQQQVETIEGTAQYVCVRIDNLMIGEFADNISQTSFINYHSGFMLDWETLKDKENWQSFIDKDIYYDTGLAYLTALDRAGDDYKDEINNNQKLIWDCLMETYYPDGTIPYDDAKIRAIKDKYGYDKYHGIAVGATDYLRNRIQLIK